MNSRTSYRTAMTNRRAALAGQRSKTDVGQSLCELSLGIMIILSVGVAIVDLATILVGHSANQRFARYTARTAARNCDTREHIDTVVANARSRTQGMIADSSILSIVGDPLVEDRGGTIRVETKMKVRLPFPVPLAPDISQITLRASSTQPAVGRAPETLYD